jgi:hypothetical protein
MPLGASQMNLLKRLAAWFKREFRPHTEEQKKLMDKRTADPFKREW